jgi:hypothetical protein
MRSVTTWQRLEPQTRNPLLEDALSAPVADPLWLLGRQSLVGEFDGRDAGSPVQVDAELTSRPVSAYRLGGVDVPDVEIGSYGPEDTPLETIVERETVRPESNDDLAAARNRRDAAQAGAHFLRMLATRGLSYDASEFEDSDALSAIPDVDELLLSVPEADLDAEGERYALAVSGRALDGDALYRAFKAADGGSSGPLPLPDPSLKTNDGYDDVYLDAVAAYREWYEELYDEPAATGDAWDEDRLEYRFAVTVGDGDERVALPADGYTGGHLDWYDFSDPEPSLTQPAEGYGSETETLSRTARPSPVQFPGMPAERWWELEDGTINVARVDAAAEDLSRLLLVEYSLVATNDWFRLPIDLDVGSFARVDRLTVTDTFGRETAIDPAGLSDGDDGEAWNLFGFDRTVDDDVERSTFLPPTLGQTTQTEPVESVDFVRDEAVNVAWAVEEAVEGPTGDRLDRHEQSQQAAAETEAAEVQPVTTAEEAYRVTTGVPAHWLPLVPEQTALATVNFRLGEMVATDEEEQTDPLGDVLDEPNVLLPEEEVPRAGKRVTRGYELARWTNGATHLWSGREVERGRGSAASGLRFDTLKQRTPSPSPEAAPIGVAVVSPSSSGGRLEHLEEEYLVLRNETGAPLDVEGWIVRDGAGREYVFGDVRLDPGGIVTLHTGDPPSGGAEDGHVYWGSGSPVWNDPADAIYIFDEEEDLRAVQTYPDLSPTLDSQIEISAQVDPLGDDRDSLEDEYVRFENTGDGAVAMTGWTVRDIAGHEYEFPDGFSLPSGQSVTLRTGTGPDSSRELYWDASRPVWNNAGDAVLVYDERESLVAGALVRSEDRRHVPTFPLPWDVIKDLSEEVRRGLPLEALTLTELDALREADRELPSDDE